MVIPEARTILLGACINNKICYCNCKVRQVVAFFDEDHFCYAYSNPNFIIHILPCSQSIVYFGIRGMSFHIWRWCLLFNYDIVQLFVIKAIFILYRNHHWIHD